MVPQTKRLPGNRITHRIYLRGTLVLKSPAIVSGGQAVHSDIDILRDFRGNPYIPGSTLAGVLRSLCAHGVSLDQEEEDIVSVFGQSVGRDRISTLSSFIFYDATTAEPISVSFRESVRLGPHKTAVHEAKLDYEVIDCEAAFTFMLEAVIRDGQYLAAQKNIDRMVHGFQDGLVRVGRKTRRGFGILALEDAAYLELDMSKKEDRELWIHFDWRHVTQPWSPSKFNVSLGNRFTTIRVPLRIPHSLLIRTYDTSLKDDDDTTSAEQLTRSDFLPVIPGTSWAGAFRSYTEELRNLEQLNALEIDDLFGRIAKNTGAEALASPLVFEESVIYGGELVRHVRAAIDRFRGGAADGALLTVRPLLNTSGSAHTELTIRVEHRNGNNDYIIGLVLLCIDELARGMITVGGETAIGRGIFTVDGVDPDEEEHLSEQVNHAVRIDGGHLPADAYRQAFIEKIPVWRSVTKA
ncbi:MULTISPECIES: RAMP superfamily CRISPR-associated protein [Cohnella]|uniref:RAMP superfamily CRISPR-associated protein n=1 Tax=Cohnella TaxID=329857 RepID=UPI0009BB5792|nr:MULTISPECIES: RAMP superfamily CRISPR-associated protein [Cohnella]MBN2982170.1 hypothetical protein [Cohnella algarum]